MSYEFADGFDFPQFLEDSGSSFTENSTGQLIFDECPFCSKPKKLYVNATTGVFNCFAGSCQQKGGPAKLVMQITGKSFPEVKEMLYGSGEIAIEDILKGKGFDNIEISLLGRGRKSKGKNDPGSILLPTELVPLDKNRDRRAWEYLTGRGYREEVINKLNLLILPYKNFGEAWGEISKNRFPEANSRDLADEEKVIVKEIARLQGRVVFPVLVDEKMKGFVARDYEGGKTPKVLNSRGNFRSFSVWNYDNAKNSETLVICEGNSSAVKCGVDRAIALLGKTATKGQLDLIKKTKAKKIVICLDIGTEEDQQKIFKDLSLYFGDSVYQVKLPPVIKLKKESIGEVSVETFDKINKLGNMSLKFYEDKNEVYILEKEKIALQLLILTENDQFDLKEQAVLLELANDLEYKDPGDYTEAEMDQLIKDSEKMTHQLII